MHRDKARRSDVEHLFSNVREMSLKIKHTATDLDDYHITIGEQKPSNVVLSDRNVNVVQLSPKG